MARVTGIGGVFLKAQDPKALAAWYAQHLGVTLSEYGGVTFEWSDEVPAGTGATAWSTFPENTKYFGTGPQRTMINYRVDDIDALVAALTAAGVEVDPKRDDSDYGRFAWAVDPEGNRFAHWKPYASVDVPERIFAYVEPPVVAPCPASCRSRLCQGQGCRDRSADQQPGARCRYGDVFACARWKGRDQVKVEEPARR